MLNPYEGNEALEDIIVGSTVGNAHIDVPGLIEPVEFETSEDEQGSLF